jgi:hypothetical protein
MNAAAYFDSLFSIESASLADLIRMYQSEFGFPATQGEEISNKLLPSISEFQRTLRGLSLFYAAISNVNGRFFLPLVVTGNLRLGAARPAPHYSAAFPDMNTLTSLPNYLTFLRNRPRYFSFLMCKLIERDADMAPLISFSTIPAVFQNGWCYEESERWSRFLQSYVDHLYRSNQPLLPESAHFVPIRSFLLQKLGLEYLQLSVVSDL